MIHWLWITNLNSKSLERWCGKLVRLSVASKVLSKLYTDKLHVYRHTEVLNEDGTTSVDKDLSQVLTDIPCRISHQQLDSSDTFTEVANVREVEIKVFCNTTVEVRKGDKLVVERVDDVDGTVLQSFTGYASQPFKFASHQEIVLSESGVA